MLGRDICHQLLWITHIVCMSKHGTSTHLCIIFLMLLVPVVLVPLSVHEKWGAFCWGLSYYACCAHRPTGYQCLTHVVCTAASPWWWCPLVLGLFLLGSIPKHGEGWFPASSGHLYIKHCCVVKHSHFRMVQSSTCVIKKHPTASKLKTSPVQQHCLSCLHWALNTDGTQMFCCNILLHHCLNAMPEEQPSKKHLQMNSSHLMANTQSDHSAARE